LTCDSRDLEIDAKFNSNNGSGCGGDEERMIIHGMLYSASNVEQELNNNSVTT
jgi:hypothetical protein